MKNVKSCSVYLIALAMLTPEFLIGRSEKTPDTIWYWSLNNIVFIFGLVAILSVLYTVLNLLYYFLMEQAGPENKPQKVNKEPFYLRFYNMLIGLKPRDQEANLVLDHNYDGIQELDNSLPPWWLYGFYLSIFIAVGYVYVYHFSDIGLSQQKEYEVAVEYAALAKAEYAAKQANNIDEDNLVVLIDAKDLSKGMDIFKRSCTACHGQEGQGGVGPNLTDNYWINGGTISNVYKTIKNGVPEKGMIAWKNQMQPVMIHQVASYIKTLEGTNPPNPKKREGKLYEEKAQSAVSLSEE